MVGRIQQSLMLKFRSHFVLLVVLFGAPLEASAQTSVPTAQALEANNPICQMIKSAARANGLPVDFFARLIWEESRFHTDEIGPLTYTGGHAQGIAQFMPGTAQEHGLVEPFNPIEALPKSSEFLAQLRDQFGNLGLAAAAYNAGPQRVRDFIGGLRDLPLETRNYVMAITGHPVEDWKNPAEQKSSEVSAVAAQAKADDAGASCREITAFLKQTPNLLVAEVQRWVPHWCRYLHQPNVSECGSVHEQAVATSGLSLVRLRRF